MADSIDFVVGRNDLRRTAFVAGADSEARDLEPDEVLVRIDKFALTANNVTYGAVGDMIGYWSFFPAQEGWGRLPAWGFADVVRSRHDAIRTGERLYGFFPMSTHVVLKAGQVSGFGFVDVASHRAPLPPFYNQYTRVAADPAYSRAQEAELALFRPLFATAFLLDDFVAENSAFGARSVLLSSASSKTALGLAFLRSRRGRESRAVGLTSRANERFVRDTDYYGNVLQYGDVRSLPRDVPTMFIDFAGNADVLRAVHEHLGENLTYSCQVGVSHWDKMAPVEGLPGPAPILFFAPDYARRRMTEWGAAEFQTRVGEVMRHFFESAARWLRVVEGRGKDAVEAAYRAMLDGKANPAEGRVLSL